MKSSEDRPVRGAKQQFMCPEFFSSPDVVQKIKDIGKELLSQDMGAKHICISGEPGIGKTRFALEVTRQETIASLVVYFESSEKFINSKLYRYLLLPDNKSRVILVIDECQERDLINIWNNISRVGARIKLITVIHELKYRDYSINFYRSPKLTEKEIKEILKTYNTPDEYLGIWAEFVDNSPRFAHMIGQNLKRFPDDLLNPIEDIYDRLISFGDPPGSVKVKKRRLVLRYLSLFKRFGWAGQHKTEARTIFTIIEKHENSITWGNFVEIINQFKKQKILQGENTLYITPKALHVRMWSEWWSKYKDIYSFDMFMNFFSDTPSLKKWFKEMFAYAHQSNAAKKVITDLFSHTGFLCDHDYLLTQENTSFFLIIARINPEATLKYLKKTIGTWTKERLLGFHAGRRGVVWALEQIVTRKNCFQDATELLLALAEAENESLGNNASGVFSDLFVSFHGGIIQTETSFEEKLPILQNALKSLSNEKRLLAIKACNNALESTQCSRITSKSDYDLLAEKPNYWAPATYGELWDAFKKVWLLLDNSFDFLSSDEKEKAVSALIARSCEISEIPSLENMVFDTLYKINSLDKYKEPLLKYVIRICRCEYLKENLKKRWKKLKNDIIGNSFNSRMLRYIGMNILSDYCRDESGDRINKTKEPIRKLVVQIISDPTLLDSKLDWLLTSRAKNGYLFGYTLAQNDSEYYFYPKIMNALRDTKKSSNVSFLGGYMRNIFEKDVNKWESLLEEIKKDKILVNWIQPITCRSGITDRAIIRILDLAQKGNIDIVNIMSDNWLRSEGFSEETFEKWIDYFIRVNSLEAVCIALSNFEAYLIDNLKHLPKKLTLRVLTHELFYNKFKQQNQDILDYIWANIAKKYIKNFPADSLCLIEKILVHFGDDCTIFKGFGDEVQELFNEIARLYPIKLLNAIEVYLKTKIIPSFYIQEWLQLGLFHTIIPCELLLSWIDNDLLSRSILIIRYCPKTFPESPKNENNLLRKLLVKYGDNKDVRDNLIVNLTSGSWWGSGTVHYRELQNHLLDYKSKEKDRNVLAFIDEYEASLESHIKWHGENEERRDF